MDMWTANMITGIVAILSAVVLLPAAIFGFILLRGKQKVQLRQLDLEERRLELEEQRRDQHILDAVDRELGR